MNYQRIYNQLVSKRQQEVPEGYTEKHHIIPKCMGGTNNSDNMVRLTAREHYIIHQLLVKMYPENKNLILAVIRFSKHIKSGLIINSKLYAWLRIQCAKRASEIMKGRIFTEEHRKNISLAQSKPYEEKYGVDGAKSLKEKRVKQTTGDGNPMYGKTHTNESKEKMSGMQLDVYKKRFEEIGCYQTEEHRKKNSEANAGENNGMYGKVHSDETKQKMQKPKSEECKLKLRAVKKQIVTCEFCGLQLTVGNYARWHGNKCKQREKVGK
jgi:hypothetical protein